MGLCSEVAVFFSELSRFGGIQHGWEPDQHTPAIEIRPRVSNLVSASSPARRRLNTAAITDASESVP